MPDFDFNLIILLKVGDRRALGRSTYVANLVRREPALARQLLQAILEGDPTTRAHAVHALMEVAATNPEIMYPIRSSLLTQAAEIDQWEVREQLCKVLPRLRLSPKERNKAAEIFVRYLTDKSSIVRAYALQGLADLAAIDPWRLKGTMALIRKAELTGTAAVRARARKLSQKFADSLRPGGAV